MPRAEIVYVLYMVVLGTWYFVFGAESSGGEIWENISTPARQPDCTHSGVLQKKTFATKHDFLHGNISNSPCQHLSPVQGKLAHILQNRAKIPARRKPYFAKHILLHSYGNKT